MRRRQSRHDTGATGLAGILLATALVFAAGCSKPATPVLGSVKRLSVAVDVLEDGSARIRETFTLHPDDAGAIRFRRVVETTEADGLELVSAAVDAVPVADADRGVSVEAARPTRVAVTWEAPGRPGADRQLALEYHARSAVAVTRPRATFSWPALVAGRGYDIGEVALTLSLPPGSTVYAGTGVSEAGWHVERTPAGISANRVSVAASESATLVAEFDLDRRRVPDPGWERNLDRQQQFLPALVAGAIFFLVVGVGAVILLRLQYPSKSRTVKRAQLAGPSDADRTVVVKGVRTAGLAGAALSLVCVGLAEWTLAFLGPWRQIIPATMLFVSLGLIASAPWYRR